jgi:endonuclease/exonuclease/phosphatase family metal-dependent hydrolase
MSMHPGKRNEELQAPQPASCAMMEPLESRQLLSSITVMTQNVYYGGGGIGSFFSGFTDLWQNVQQSKIPERALAIATEIKHARPDLVALQEVVIWRTGSIFRSSAQDVRYDFLAQMMRRLKRGKARYAVVSKVTNADWEVPGQVGSSIRNIRMTDQDVILARVGPGARLRIIDEAHGSFRQRVDVPIPGLGGDIDFTRGWTSVDARIGQNGPRFRFINTHLEVLDTQIQQRQARALLAGRAKTRLPVTLAGDFNSDANSGGSTYTLLQDAGFTDSWQQVHPSNSGPTCCQDDDLRNPDSKLSTRIDLVMYRTNHVDPTAAELVGEEPGDKTPSGLWPSDHAGVLIRLNLE